MVGLVWHSMVGLVWYGMVWYGMVGLVPYMLICQYLANMASIKPRGVVVVVGGGGWEKPQYSYLSPAKLRLGLSLAIPRTTTRCGILNYFSQPSLTILGKYLRHLS